MLVVVAVAGLVTWQTVERQNREQHLAIVNAVAEAQAADAALRKAATELKPRIGEAEVLREEVGTVLGDSDEAVLALDEALGVAEALFAEIDDNPVAVPRSVVGAAAAQLQDEDQLALVNPVMSNLAAAVNSSTRAMSVRKLEDARANLAEATRVFDESIAAAGRLKSRIDMWADQLERERLELQALAEAPTDHLSGAEKKAAKSQARKAAKKADKLGREIATLMRDSARLRNAVAAAQASGGAATGDEPEALDATAKARLASAAEVKALTTTVRTAHPDLPSAVTLEALGGGSPGEVIDSPAPGQVSEP